MTAAKTDLKKNLIFGINSSSQNSRNIFQFKKFLRRYQSFQVFMFIVAVKTQTWITLHFEKPY